MDDLLDRGIIFFNSASYFEAHEVWEDLWRSEPGSIRDFYQGLIHAAVGLLHLTRGNAAGAKSQLSKALARLDPYPSSTLGIDLERLRQDLRKVLDRMDIEALSDVRIVRLKRPHDVVQSDGTS